MNILGLIIGFVIGAVIGTLLAVKKNPHVDTCTEYGIINVEKNGKKGAIIL